MVGVAFVYAGFALCFVGLIALIRPLRWLRLDTRRRGAILLASGVAISATGMTLPAGERHTGTPRSRLDEYMPRYQFHEFHSLHVAARPERVYDAIQNVQAGDILFFTTLTWMRRFGRKGPESIINAPDTMPILEIATRTTFMTLADDPSREILVGTTVLAPTGRRKDTPQTPQAFRAVRDPGFALAAMNFRITPDESGGSLLTTETRVFATDPGARRRFARYWRVIYPGSALIRRRWLRAIRQRAEVP
ncbi:MAG: hypothetical protein ACT4P7_22050 [Gemmatimonadaceae bacterium]